MVAPLLAGSGVLLLSLLSYGVATGLLIRLAARLIRGGHARLSLRKDVLVMTALTLLTAAMHLTQVGLWAVLLLACEELPTFEQAFYVSAENYTALGYGDVLLSGRWRLLGPLEVINGLLLVGLSSAVLFAVLSHLLAGRLGLPPADVAVPAPADTSPVTRQAVR
jgi:hypothetical protein